MVVDEAAVLVSLMEPGEGADFTFTFWVFRERGLYPPEYEWISVGFFSFL
jgi:hypothetical protein